MATSSLAKSFVISTRKEAETLAKMFEESIKYPEKNSHRFDNVRVHTMTKTEIQEMINDTARK